MLTTGLHMCTRVCTQCILEIRNSRIHVQNKQISIQKKECGLSEITPTLPLAPPDDLDKGGESVLV